MKHHSVSRIGTLLTTTAILVVLCGSLAESLGQTSQTVPRLPDGTPNLGRTGVGRGGIWTNPMGTLNYADILVDPPKSEGIPMQPWAKAVQHYRAVVMNERDDPQGFCIPPPVSYTRARPMEFLQLPDQKRIIQITEFPGNTWREIYMDGRPHPPKEELENFPSFMGHSVGRWDGDTLVVDTVGFNEGTWFDRTGHPHTNQLHLVERFTRTNLNTLHVEMTIEDPWAYTRPWKVAMDLVWRPDSVMNHYYCQENNRWQENYIKATKGVTGTGNAGADSGHGHPVKGTFVGEWGANASAQDVFLLEMDWDGKNIVGTINPGPEGVPIVRADLDLTDWSLHIEGGAGANRVVIDGKFENVSWLARSLAGTYVRGNQRGTFRVNRQY